MGRGGSQSTCWGRSVIEGRGRRHRGSRVQRESRLAIYRYAEEGRSIDVGRTSAVAVSKNVVL